MRWKSSHGVSLQSHLGVRAITSRRNHKCKGPEMRVCPAFAEKQQGDQCGWKRMREEERNRRRGQVGKERQVIKGLKGHSEDTGC